MILAPVSRMQARGAPKDSVALGKVVTVVACPKRDKPGEVRAERIYAGPYRQAVDQAPGAPSGAAMSASGLVSMALWIAVIVAGRMIASV